MKRQIIDAPGAGCSVAWHLQNGRSRIQRGLAADGFRGDYPYAGVTVVAENKDSDEDSSASITVETVRDVFAEGVAFGVEDVLRDSFLEAADIIRDRKLSGCSAAAIAVSGTHVWYAMAGNCRIYKIDSDGVKCLIHDQSAANEMSMSPDHTDYHRKIREMKSWLGSSSPESNEASDPEGVPNVSTESNEASDPEGVPNVSTESNEASDPTGFSGNNTVKLICGHTRIKHDTTYVILTAGGWTQFQSNANTLHRRGSKNTLEGWLSSISREMKLAYRRQGGALGAVSGVKKGNRRSVSWKSIAYIAAFLGLIGFLVFANPFSMNSEATDQEKTDLFSSDSVEEIVQPIPPDTLSDIDVNQESWLLSIFSNSLFPAEEEIPESTTVDISADLPLQVVQVGGSVPELNPDTFAVSLNSEPDLQWENFTPGIYTIRGDTASLMLAQIISPAYPELEVIEINRIITVRENGVAESARWLSSLPPDNATDTGIIVETRSSVAGGADWIRNYPIFVNGNRTDRAGEAGGFMGDSLPGLPSLRNPLCYRLVVIL